MQKTSSRVAGRTPNGAVKKILANTGCYSVAPFRFDSVVVVFTRLCLLLGFC